MEGCTNQAWLDSVYDKLLVKMKAECERVGLSLIHISEPTRL